jgi:hypothetical protein
MKGIQGLILAIGLGIAGALFNWAYLTNRSREAEKVEFLIIAPGVTVERGEKLSEDKLDKVGVPLAAVGNLKDIAVYSSEIRTVIDMPVARTLTEKTLVLRDDLKTPPPELAFGQPTPNERAMPIAMDPSRFVPSLYRPGDQISFVFPKYASAGPTPAARPAADPAKGSDEPLKPAPEVPVIPSPTAEREIVGPFKILALGNRLGSVEVMRAANIRPLQENVITISVSVQGEKLEDKAQKLFALLEATNRQHVEIMLHPRRP